MNPISFSNQIHQGIDRIVLEMAMQIGLPPDQIKPIGQASSIALKVQGLPDVMLSVAEDRLWIWSLLPIHDERSLMLHASEALSILTTAIEGVETGQLTLGMSEHGYELKALVELDLLKRDHGLKQVFQGFVAQLYRFCEVYQIKGA
ncbi:hypothetical protein [Chromobacterium vaccinii]|uniref:Type III secretion system chaperone SpaK n=1 Tax=Chromobacterium vaccinii TaxID=1108595 RepID=A0A1D9LLI6_9NEIS|nr:hypothetical protein [Chromobacterium vaccinii]AOZ52136.1 hypothetical protein BKX93_20450 [Chromobacterium vaccinii]